MGDLVGRANLARRLDNLLTDREAIGAISQQTVAVNFAHRHSPGDGGRTLLSQRVLAAQRIFLGAPPCAFESIALCSMRIGQSEEIPWDGSRIRSRL